MIARHCDQESENGEGVEVIKYEPCEDPKYGSGHYTEKRIHLYKLFSLNFTLYLSYSFVIKGDYPVGVIQLFLIYFILKKNPGIIIHIQLRNIEY
jgi:hypothetical protein